MYRLASAVQHYAWGSTSQIPDLLGIEADGRPFAELWMGAHPAAPSSVRADSGVNEPVTDLLAREPLTTVGSRVHEAFGPHLPYLFKVLSVARPLSLQVHPNVEQARAGFAREEAAGIAPTAAERCFKDAHHKPELVVALSRFEALSGFRNPHRVLELLDGLDGSLADRLRGLLGERTSADGLRAAFEALLAPAPAAEVAELAAACGRRLASGSPSPRADGTVVALAQWYPGDPGAVASLFLNRVTLEPGEAMFVPAGAVHAYLEGTALEIMACSDNVLRAGLTSKHIDVPALLECTEYLPGPPSRPSPANGGTGTVVYRAPTPEFALALTRLPSSGQSVELLAQGPRIVLCLSGAVELVTPAERLHARRGDVVLVTDADGPLQVRGPGEVATAFTPVPGVGGDAPVGTVTAALAPVNTSRR